MSDHRGDKTKVRRLPNSAAGTRRNASATTKPLLKLSPLWCLQLQFNLVGNSNLEKSETTTVIVCPE
ncbi:hypothetical protein EG68_05297 [Paragonimus skrjabini miyazakii]|uniref:Uncharacterized protein n=1 Tax=Paragonimus skrjabini miyazakii TaxID=59628 RepID=A0A8S9YXH8_9TREM|nr:hypothetical protein EG68_05297 [Paragonimus skrjabini miyazakii]